ncbi:MAG: YqaE/Pmp3 family rane protein [Pseudomonadota bacterium]|nr:YqaE/Pmp3 family rane protein [Pseudomonadota bacterium]
MHHRFIYFLTILMPGFSMFFIEEYIVAILCFILQMSLIGWPIASIWACSTLTKYYKKQKHLEHQQYKEQHHE